MNNIDEIFRAALLSMLSSARGAQAKLAREAEVHPPYLNRILKGGTGSDDVYRRIAAAFGYKGREYEDFLDLGRSILTNANKAGDSALKFKLQPQRPPAEVSASKSRNEGDGISDARRFQLALKDYIRRDGEASHAKFKNKTALAKASGVDFKLLNKIYLGQKEADESTQAALARAIGMPLKEIIAAGQNSAEKMQRALTSVRRSSPNNKTDFRARPLPVFGLAACGMEGWERKIQVSVSLSPLVFGPNAFVVMSVGFSMIPAGIGQGMFCYCDPDVEPIKGDAVYVFNGPSNASTIKEFVGWGKEAGTKPGWLKLRGWRDPDQWNRQVEYHLEMPSAQVTEIATVVCVRRRM